MKVVDNEKLATHWRHICSFWGCKLESEKLYPITCEIIGEDTYYFVSDGNDKLSAEWLKQYCIGDFVVKE